MYCIRIKCNIWQKCNHSLFSRFDCNVIMKPYKGSVYESRISAVDFACGHFRVVIRNSPTSHMPVRRGHPLSLFHTLLLISQTAVFPHKRLYLGTEAAES